MLSNRQKQVAKEVFEGNLAEEEILEQFKLSPMVLQKWFSQDEFEQELDRLCQGSNRQAQFTIARFAPIAALKLVELIGSDKPDVARRTALELIDRCLKITGSAKVTDQQQDSTEQLTDEQAQQMLITLADGMKDSG